MTVRRIAYDPEIAGLRIEAHPDPVPQTGGFLADVTHGGVCGTDAHRLAGHLPAPAGSIALGHEAVGRVLQVSSDGATDSAGRPLHVGDRVAWYAPAACGHCRACTVDRDPATCENLSWPYPVDRAGAAGFQDVASIGSNVPSYRLPDDLSDVAAGAFGCAMPTALSAIDRAGSLTMGSTAVVLGSGPVGLAATLALSQYGLERLIVVGTGGDRLGAASAFGATNTFDLSRISVDERRERILELTDGRGADLVFEAAGVPAAFADGLDLLAIGGTLLVVGLYSGVASATVDPVLINNRKLRIIGSLGSDPAHFIRGLDLVARVQHRLKIEELVGAQFFPLAETERAILTLGSGATVKAFVTPQSDRDDFVHSLQRETISN